MDVEELTGPGGAAVAGAVLGPAFVEDPVWAWLVRGSRREQRLVTGFTTLAASAQRRPGARLLATRERTVAAVWLPPEGWRQRPADFLRSAPGLARCVRAGVLRGLRMQAVMERHHPREPHWYLEALGALPEARGTGVGGRVLQPVLDQCDEMRLPAYLESSNPRNWSFYERHGFVRGTPLPVPAGCPVLLPMRRDPR